MADLSHDDLTRLHRVFVRYANLYDPQDRRIHEWLATEITAALVREIEEGNMNDEVVRDCMRYLKARFLAHKLPPEHVIEDVVKYILQNHPEEPGVFRLEPHPPEI